MSKLEDVGRYCRGAWGHPKVRRSAWAVLVLLGLDLVLLAFFWAPAASIHHRLKNEITEYRWAKREALDAQTLTDRYALLAREAKWIESKWEAPANQSGLVQSLDRLAARCGLKVLSQDFDAVDSFGEAGSKGGGKVLRQNLSLSGDYGKLRQFLDKLESLPTLTLVEQARIDRAGASGGRIRASLQLCTYVQSKGKEP